MPDTFQPGDRVRLLLDYLDVPGGACGTLEECLDRLAVRFDGHAKLYYLDPPCRFADSLEVIPDDRLVQLTFDWWLNFGDWKGERGDPDDF